jgi:hypothetical protein
MMHDPGSPPADGWNGHGRPAVQLAGRASDHDRTRQLGSHRLAAMQQAETEDGGGGQRNPWRQAGERWTATGWPWLMSGAYRRFCFVAIFTITPRRPDKKALPMAHRSSVPEHACPAPCRVDRHHHPRCHPSPRRGTTPPVGCCSRLSPPGSWLRCVRRLAWLACNACAGT